jgi:peptidoglycan hydrolase-like protein with peptidoglycan-binding domain
MAAPGMTMPGTTMPGTTPGMATPGTPSGTTVPGAPATTALPPAGDGQASVEQVRSVQQALQSKGLHPGAVDGVMGPGTQQAVRDFQRSQNLPETGRIDAQTLEKLGVASR